MTNHTDNKGNVRMIDISDKDITKRIAKAKGYIGLSKEALDSIVNGANKKGDVLTVAQIAGITGAKQTSSLVPLSHQVNLKSIQIFFEIEKDGISCISEVITDSNTGVEIEAMLSVQLSLLTIYDMCKYVDKSMVISDIKLISKTGGKSGDFRRE
mgnify:CR=1 FL=1|tara:strand:+ start:382 stop:846 length:465 start_codon:yes stop_codon:yes gene_type:complete